MQACQQLEGPQVNASTPLEARPRHCRQCHAPGFMPASACVQGCAQAGALIGHARWESGQVPTPTQLRLATETNVAGRVRAAVADGLGPLSPQRRGRLRVGRRSMCLPARTCGCTHVCIGMPRIPMCLHTDPARKAWPQPPHVIRTMTQVTHPLSASLQGQEAAAAIGTQSPPQPWVRAWYSSVPNHGLNTTSRIGGLDWIEKDAWGRTCARLMGASQARIRACGGSTLPPGVRYDDGEPARVGRSSRGSKSAVRLGESAVYVHVVYARVQAMRWCERKGSVCGRDFIFWVKAAGLAGKQTDR